MVDLLKKRLWNLEPGTPEVAYELMKDFMRAGRYNSDIGGILFMSVMAGGEESLNEWRRLIASTIVWPG